MPWTAWAAGLIGTLGLIRQTRLVRGVVEAVLDAQLDHLVAA